jgi:hypothetical protein
MELLRARSDLQKRLDRAEEQKAYYKKREGRLVEALNDMDGIVYTALNEHLDDDNHMLWDLLGDVKSRKHAALKETGHK